MTRIDDDHRRISAMVAVMLHRQFNQSEENLKEFTDTKVRVRQRGRLGQPSSFKPKSLDLIPINILHRQAQYGVIHDDGESCYDSTLMLGNKGNRVRQRMIGGKAQAVIARRLVAARLVI